MTKNVCPRGVGAVGAVGATSDERDGCRASVRGLPADATPTFRDPTSAHHGEGTEADSFAIHVDEIRRLYAEGEIEAALDLASRVTPPTLAFSLRSIPVVVVTSRELMKLPLDARSGFLVARIDGVSNLQTLLDVCAMPTGEAMSLLEELLALGAVRLVPPPASASQPT